MRRAGADEEKKKGGRGKPAIVATSPAAAPPAPKAEAASLTGSLAAGSRSPNRTRTQTALTPGPLCADQIAAGASELEEIRAAYVAWRCLRGRVGRR